MGAVADWILSVVLRAIVPVMLIGILVFISLSVETFTFFFWGIAQLLPEGVMASPVVFDNVARPQFDRNSVVLPWSIALLLTLFLSFALAYAGLEKPKGVWQVVWGIGVYSGTLVGLHAINMLSANLGAAFSSLMEKLNAQIGPYMGALGLLLEEGILVGITALTGGGWTYLVFSAFYFALLRVGIFFGVLFYTFARLLFLFLAPLAAVAFAFYVGARLSGSFFVTKLPLAKYGAMAGISLILLPILLSLISLGFEAMKDSVDAHCQVLAHFNDPITHPVISGIIDGLKDITEKNAYPLTGDRCGEAYAQECARLLGRQVLNAGIAVLANIAPFFLLLTLWKMRGKV